MRDLIDTEILLANALERYTTDRGEGDQPVHEICSGQVRAAVW